MALAGSWSDVRGAHIQAFTFLFDCAGTLKITVGIILYDSFILILKNRRRVKLQSLQFYY